MLWFLSSDSFTHCMLLWTEVSYCKCKRVASYVYYCHSLGP